MWVLREDLRKRFVKAETTLFKLRYATDLNVEKEAFLRSWDFGWEQVRGRMICLLRSG